jgi:hypothetical protein
MKRLARKVVLRFRLFGRRTEGASAVEFAIIGTVLLFFIGGILDLSHVWYMKNLMANASREGARYGTRYWIDPTTKNRILPKNLNPTIQNYILRTNAENGDKGGWGLLQFMPTDANTQVTLGGPASTETDAAALNYPMSEDLQVTITSRKYWFILGAFVPTLGDYKDLTVTTTMKCE